MQDRFALVPALRLDYGKIGRVVGVKIFSRDAGDKLDAGNGFAGGAPAAANAPAAYANVGQSKGRTSATGVATEAAPLKEPAFEDKRLEFGKARCYSVTSVGGSATRRVESPMSDPACVTPVDTFGPSAPTGLAAVAGPGTISLIWDAVTSGWSRPRPAASKRSHPHPSSGTCGRYCVCFPRGATLPESCSASSRERS